MGHVVSLLSWSYLLKKRLKWLKVTQFFVRKTLNDGRGRPNLRTDMNQVTNLKSLDFTWKKVAKLLVVSMEFSRSPYFCNYPFCGRMCCKTSICISCCVEANDSPAPELWNSMLSPLLPLHFLEQFFQLLLNRWLLFLNHLLFSHVPQIYKWLHYFFWDILIIHDSVYKRDAVTTDFLSLLN